MKRNVVIASVAAAALIGGGTATALAVTSGEGSPAQSAGSRTEDGTQVNGAGAGDDTSNSPSTSDTSDTDSAGLDDRGDDSVKVATSAEVSAADAIGVALRHTAGTAVSAELDDEDGAVVWSVDVLPASGTTWHSIRIDPATGKVLDSRTEYEDDTAEVRAALRGTSTSATEAAEAAAAKGAVTSVDLEDDGGSYAWDLETRSPDGMERDWRIGVNGTSVTAAPADDGRRDDDRHDDSRHGDDRQDDHRHDGDRQDDDRQDD
jgi:uncharacterized membrane protein YkoI